MNYSVSSPIDWVYSDRILCIDCKLKRLVHKYTHAYFFLIFPNINFLNPIFIIYSECQSRNTILPASKSGGICFIRGEITCYPPVKVYFYKQTLYIIFPFENSLNDRENYLNAYYYTQLYL